MAVSPPTLEERGKTDVAVPHWNILPGERATVALILTACGQVLKRGGLYYFEVLP